MSCELHTSNYGNPKYHSPTYTAHRPSRRSTCSRRASATPRPACCSWGCTPTPCTHAGGATISVRVCKHVGARMERGRTGTNRGEATGAATSTARGLARRHNLVDGATGTISSREGSPVSKCPPLRAELLLVTVLASRARGGHCSSSMVSHCPTVRLACTSSQYVITTAQPLAVQQGPVVRPVLRQGAVPPRRCAAPPGLAGRTGGLPV